MNDEIANDTASPRKISQSVGALFVGFVVNVALSLGTDVGLHAIGILPAISERMSDQQLLLAASYRTVYSIFTSYLVARLAPRKPLAHALIGGAIGMSIGAIGAIATWNRDLGPHWYPLALVVMAMPTAWLGGTLRVAQMRPKVD